jgi:hypothetical protein
LIILTAAYLTEVDDESKSLHVLEKVHSTSPFQPPGLLCYYSQRVELRGTQRALRGEICGIGNDSG